MIAYKGKGKITWSGPLAITITWLILMLPVGAMALGLVLVVFLTAAPFLFLEWLMGKVQS